MRIKKIYLYVWSKENPLKGSIEFETENEDKIELVLDEKSIETVIKACADSLVRVSKDAADRLVEAIKKEVK